MARESDRESQTALTKLYIQFEVLGPPLKLSFVHSLQPLRVFNSSIRRTTVHSPSTILPMNKYLLGIMNFSLLSILCVHACACACLSAHSLNVYTISRYHILTSIKFNSIFHRKGCDRDIHFINTISGWRVQRSELRKMYHSYEMCPPQTP